MLRCACSLDWTLEASPTLPDDRQISYALSIVAVNRIVACSIISYMSHYPSRLHPATTASAERQDGLAYSPVWDRFQVAIRLCPALVSQDSFGRNFNSIDDSCISTTPTINNHHSIHVYTSTTIHRIAAHTTVRALPLVFPALSIDHVMDAWKSCQIFTSRKL